MSDLLTLEYNLAELPSSQHRAGLAGLVLMLRWLEKEPDKKGICKVVNIDETSAKFEFDQEGFRYLFDKAYAASKEEVETDKIRKNKSGEEVTPLRHETRTVLDKRGNAKEKTVYFYPQVIPHGAFLVDFDRSPEGVWIKLWRNMIWSILRGVPATRRPYDERSEGTFTEDADKVWQDLVKKSHQSVDLPSTYFIGAQANSAENVPFKDIARFQFLLHFWSFVTQVYVPIAWKFDRKSSSEKPQDNGYALVIPDVADIKTFCDEFPDLLRGRGSDILGYRPKECLIDLAAEAGLDMMHHIDERLAGKAHQQVSDLLLGVDVVHLEKQGNNIRLWGNSRIDPIKRNLDEYAHVKGRNKNRLFRRQRLLNLLKGEHKWFAGFDSLLSKTDSDQTIGQSFFRNDVRTAFKEAEEILGSITNGGNNMDSQPIPKTMESVIYDLVWTYIREKLSNKYDLEWGKVKGTPQERDYNEKKGKIAREAFLAIRSRTDDDFIEYFASTICSYHQFQLKESNGFELIAQALYDEEKRNQVRTLTMLAFSANGYSPRSEQQGESNE